MKEKARALTGAVLLLVLAQTLLLLWKAALGALLTPDAFGEKMITMSGMALLTAASFQLCRKKGIGLHFLPGRVSRGYLIAAVLTAVLILASPDNYTQGARGPLLRLYASIITPLFEELIFRGWLFGRLEGAGLRGWAAVWISAGLFSLWHIGYILGALWAGQWLSLTKLAVGLAYGLITGAVRHKTGGWMPSLLVHAALNTLLG